MVHHVDQALAASEATRRIADGIAGARVQLVGTSGTITTLAAVHLSLRRYDRRQIDGLAMDRAEIDAVSLRLRSMSNAERGAHPCIGPGRADLVAAGCAILEAILRTWPATMLRVADRGLREGILHGLMGQSLERALATPGIAGTEPPPAISSGPVGLP
jgi:exopolyphosphatase/guanosine-5'-triphosphate,3'-diphosphate pyrophosphatase